MFFGFHHLGNSNGVSARYGLDVFFFYLLFGTRKRSECVHQFNVLSKILLFIFSHFRMGNSVKCYKNMQIHIVAFSKKIAIFLFFFPCRRAPAPLQCEQNGTSQVNFKWVASWHGTFSVSSNSKKKTRENIKKWKNSDASERKKEKEIGPKKT